MSDPAYALQVALVAAIKALGTAAGQNVFDQPPTSNPFPRVTVGEGQSVDNSVPGCYDGTESFLQVDVWSRANGYPQVKQIASAIRDRLHDGALTLNGHTLELLRVQSTDYSRDPDGITSRARLLVRALTQPTD